MAYPEIKKVLYWQKDVDDDIYEYMNEMLGQSDIMLLFCSANASESEPVKMEWRAALKKKMKIIPIFEQSEYIPDLLATKLGVRFQMEDLDRMIEEIYRLILKKLKI